MIERDHRIAALAVALHGGTVDGDDVEFAVVVAIDQAHAAAHGFDDVLLVGRRNVRDRKAGLLRDVFELRDGWLRVGLPYFLQRCTRWGLQELFARAERGRQQSHRTEKESTRKAGLA